MRTRPTLAALALVLAGVAHAEPVLYDFNFFAPDMFAAGTVPSGLSANRFELGSPWGGLCWNLDVGGTNNFACGGFGSSVSRFTVQAQAGYSFDVQGLSFEGYVPDVQYGPTAFAVYTSLDGFGQALISGNFANLAEMSQQFYGAGLAAQNLTGPLEVRIVSSGRDGLPASVWLLDNVRLDVSVNRLQTVPEPGSAALVLAALLAGGVVGRRPWPLTDRQPVTRAGSSSRSRWST